MKRRQTTFEWEMSDEVPETLFLDAAPPPLASAPTLPDAGDIGRASIGSSRRRQWLGISFWSVVLVAAILWILSNQAAEGARVLQERTIVQLQQAIDREQRQPEGRGQAVQLDFIDDSTPPAWQTECLREPYHMPDRGESELGSLRVAQIEFCSEQVVADLVDETSAMRVTRAYRQQNGRWLRTTPSPDCWGPQTVVESAYFRFWVRERDVRAVEEAIGSIDRLYLDMREQIGLTPPDKPVERHLIVVDILRLTPEILNHEQGSTMAIHLPSPSLIMSPASLDEAEILLQTAAAPLAELAIRDTFCAGNDRCDGYPYTLKLGLLLWLQWNGSDLITWTPNRAAYADSWHAYLSYYDAPPFYRLVSMATADIDYWLQDSPQTNIQEICSPQDDECTSNQQMSTLIRYGYLFQPYVVVMAAESMIEWLIVEEGSDVIPELVDVIDKFYDFPSAIEAVSGMSVGQAQSEWHAYLARHHNESHRDAVDPGSVLQQ